MKAPLEIRGVIYQAEVIDGIRYLDGMNSDEFIDYLVKKRDYKTLSDLVFVGYNILNNQTTNE